MPTGRGGPAKKTVTGRRGSTHEAGEGRVSLTVVRSELEPLPVHPPRALPAKGTVEEAVPPIGGQFI